MVAPQASSARAVRRSSGSFLIGDDLSGGADVVIDAVGSAASVDEAIGTARPRGRVVLVGMPGRVSVDLTALWHRETELVGAYTYGTEHLADGTTARTFDLAIDLVAEPISVGWSRPPTGSRTTRTPSSTPPRPDPEARSRSASTCADTPTERSARGRRRAPT